MTDVELWLIDTTAQSPGPLDDDETARLARIGDPADRRRFAAAHGALRRIVAERLGVAGPEVRWRRGPNGKPAVDGHHLQVNLTHSGDLAMVAVAGERPVGVDLQEIVAGLDVVAMAARFYPPDEAELVAAGGHERFAQLWTRKEAVVKAAGDRLTRGLALPVAGEPPPAVRYDGMTYTVADVAAPEGFRAAVAAAGPEPFTIRMR
jgi:4'-phosphopantetheinyl transferase